MRAMLLSAGKGTRLGEIGATRPKPMLMIGRHAILEFGIANLVGHGIRDIVINTHHLGEVIRNELGDGRHLGARLQYIHEPTLLGTGGGLRNALGLLDPDQQDEPFISLNGKLIFDLDITALLAAYHAADRACRAATAKPAAASNSPGGPLLGMMVVQRVPEAETWGAVDVRTTPAGQHDMRGPWVANILGSGSHMFCGVHVTRPSIVRRLPEGEACMVRQGYLPWLQAGGRVAAYEHFCDGVHGYFAEHSTPERYRVSEAYLLGAAARHHASKYGTSSAAQTPIEPLPLRYPPGRLLPR